MFLRALRHLSFEDYYYYYCSVKWIGCVFRGSWRWTVGVISVAFAVTPSDSPLFWLPGQCRPVASPRFGSHSLQGGNGTNQGTKISFRCLPAYQLVGNEKILCVAKGNSTDWTGTFPECQGKTVPVRNEFGFKVAVIASIISSAIILLLSTAFLTCCLVKCVKKNERRKQRGVQTWFQIECDVGEDPRAPYYGNKSRYNHNNNNSSGCCDKFRDTRLVADVERGLENRGFCRYKNLRTTSGLAEV
uniref:Sushi domain-containing protein n=1 Tax=Callorhinchus milii TaxID=7868 RepID=A0A4W3IHW0_CALMI